jgi:hypothetical protein
MSLSRRLALALSIVVLPACAAIQVNPGAERIRITNTEPQGCENLGDVVGTQGNVITGGYTSNENLIIGARNDLKNKAFTLGANTVFMLTSTTGQASGQYGGATSSSHLMGVAFKCPPP